MKPRSIARQARHLPPISNPSLERKIVVRKLERGARLFRCWLAAVFALALCAADRLPGATFTVTKTTDSGNGTLRQAILDANLTTALDTIAFNISGSGLKTITLASALPPITNAVIIDGATQPGYTGVTPLIELDGTSAGAAIGLDIRSGGCLIRALTINRFQFPGIVIEINGSNVVERCFIGTDSFGTVARGNGVASLSDGIAIFSSGNLIGGTTANAGNVISGNGRYGIGLIGSLAQNNRIEANFIGTDLLGLAAIPNRDGIGVTDAPRNSIGGTNIAARNIISGNTEEGIELGGANATGNLIARNFIGLNLTGQTALPNGGNGILISTTSSFPGPASANIVGGSGIGNGISGNGRDGIQMGFGTVSNQVSGNAIGISSNGLVVIPNGRHGVSIFDSTNNAITILGRSANYIIGNRSNGVFIGRGGLNSGSVSNVVRGNLIATNGLDGVQLSGGANYNQILRNALGAVLFSDGTRVLGNARHGVAIIDSTNNLIGGIPSLYNNVSGNRSNGVFISAGSVSNIVRANQIGNSTFGNGGSGVFVQGSWNTIGGSGAQDGNRISYNGTNLLQHGHGVVIASGSHNPIPGNLIWGNSGRGIDLGNDSFTVNDLGDGDIGANDLQNYPVVTHVTFDPTRGSKEITWTLNSKPNRFYDIEFFANSVPDPSGFGEGEERVGSAFALTDAKGMAVFTSQFPLDRRYIAATATDSFDQNTSEFSPVDTDGDAIADAWETRGIDYDEDGTIDLALVGANSDHKDIYVEIDCMMGHVPNTANLQRASTGTGQGDGFENAPKESVQNPDGKPGISIHYELDETSLPAASWDSTGFLFFDILKSNYFGTPIQRLSTNAAQIIEAKKLFYHYCIFADSVPDAGGVCRATGASDFYIANGTDVARPNWDPLPSGFMHELGHSLGLDHGGADENNFKPNYHSVMNYGWVFPKPGNRPWLIDYSREEFGLLDEAHLDENLGLGASTNHAGHMVVVGPYFVGNVPVPVKPVPEFGPVDWNGNGASTDTDVDRDLNYLSGSDSSPDDILSPCEDWSKLRFYFLDNPYKVGVHIGEFTNDLSPSILKAFEKLGTGTGYLQFAQPFYSANETDAVATVTVTRIFETEGTVTVVLSFFDGTATNGLDYLATNTVVVFSGSESNKTVAIPILNDGVAEAPETLRVVLSNPTGGATIGQYGQATITIIDDDPPARFTVINTNDSGAGSLRQAILDANSAAGLAIVDFNIPGPSGLTISPASALPPVTHPMTTIDGTTQPGFAGAPIIELNGASAGGLSDGFQIRAGKCVVRGLVINRFSASGIKLSSDGASRVEGCYLGLNRLGTLNQMNGTYGVYVESPNNVIGGTNAAARNFISGNSAGILISLGTPLGPPATNNQVVGNVVGLGVDGSRQGNAGAGIQIQGSQNFIGGTAAGAPNVISGNGSGVNIQTGVGDVIQGNYIGTDLTGSVVRSNNGNGITISGSGHIIGGNQAGMGNVISGNALRGIELNGENVTVQGNRIGTDAAGHNALPNLTGGIWISGSSNQIGSTTLFSANTIAFNQGPGVRISLAANNSIRGNSIFGNTNASPVSEILGIDLDPPGVSLNDTNDTDIGANLLQNFPLLTRATNSLTGTLINGTLNSRSNTSYIIDFYANSAIDPSGYGEGQFWIGSTNVATDGNGNATFTALSPAIYLPGRYITTTATDPAGNTSEFSPAIFAESAVTGRVFTVVNVNDSGAGSLRQAILDANANVSERDTIEFNIPGVDVQTIRPLSPLPPLTDPVVIDGYTQSGSSPNTAPSGDNAVLQIELDGSVAGIGYGLRIEGGGSIVRGLIINRFGTGAGLFDTEVGGIRLATRRGNHIEGCFIGTDSGGTLARPNFRMGINIFGSPDNVVGGTLPGQRNLISGSAPCPGTIGPADGVSLNGASTNTLIQGNLIGTAVDGISPLGNSAFGISVASAKLASVTIGGTVPGSANTIAFNGRVLPDNSLFGGGISDPVNSKSTAILGNSIHSNLGLGIQGNLVNSQAGSLNFPFLSSATSSNGITTIQGRLNGISNALHRIEFFANDTLDPSSYGEGKVFLGATNVPTGANGFVAFTAVLPVAVSNGTFLSATATDDENNTSEFSPRLTVGDVLTNVIVVNSFNDVDDGVANTNHTSLREAILAANNHPGPDTIRFAIGTGAKAIGLTNSLPALLDAGTTVDATTQPGFAGQPLIYLDGLLLAPTGFRLYSPSNTIRGFAINRFGYGIYGDALYSSPFGGFNIIEENYLGTDLNGGGIGAQDYGIYFTSSFPSGDFPSNRVGGATATARNVISGNKRAGVYAFGSTGNTIAGNFIGTDRTGTNALGNGIDIQPIGGVFLQRCPGSVIGGAAPGAGNVISGNGSLFQTQFFLWDDCSGTVVQGNYIGTDATGRTNLVPTFKGIDVAPYGGILIRSNLICGFPAMSLNGPTNRVEGNFIGTDATGTRSFGLPNGLVIESGGIGNVIGGTNAGSRNLISAGNVGITIRGQSNVIQGNFIGTKIDGISPLGNFSNGVLVQNSFNLIGGVNAGEGNTIAFNGGAGISVTTGTNNALLGNLVFANTSLGIDLGATGVTTNDLGDLDTGANNLQNFPVISSAGNTGTATLIAGVLNSRANTSYRIEFFVNTNCHSSGQGQGRTFLNAVTATTDASGNAPISFTYPVAIPIGQVITATATDPDNNTSEFSTCVTVVVATNSNPELPPIITIINPTPTNGDRFGYSVAALDSGRVLIGSSKSDWSEPDAAYLYSISGTLLTTFTNAGLPFGDGFGRTVAPLGNNLVLIGADFAGPSQTGAAYLFNTNGALLMTFANPNPSPSPLDSFGISVAGVGSDRVLIGAEEEDTGALNAGVAYLFSTNGTLLKTFTNPTPENWEYFGDSVAAVGNDWLLIGAYADNTGASETGSVYLFNTNGTLLTIITNPTPASQDYFSFFSAVAAVGNDRILIGAYLDDTGATDSGAAYLFSTNGTLLMTFTNPTPAVDDEFGYAVAAVGNDRVLISAYRDDTGAMDAGAVYLFSTNGTLLMTLTNPTPAIGDWFGWSVAAVGNEWALVGAVGDDTSGTDAGAAYLFHIPPAFTPQLSIRLTATNTVAISWPSPSPSFVLQQNTNGIATPNWSNSVPPLDDGNNKTIIINQPEGSRFFRLFKP